MTTFNEKDRLIGTAEYNTNFWNVMRGNRYAADSIQGGKDISTGGFALPAEADDKLRKAIKRESLFRNLATVVKAYNGSSRIFAKDCDDLAAWVPENGNIPIYDGMDDLPAISWRCTSWRYSSSWMMPSSTVGRDVFVAASGASTNATVVRPCSCPVIFSQPSGE